MHVACVNACPDTAILGIALPESQVETRAAAFAADEADPVSARASIDAHFVHTQKYAEVPARKGLEPAAFGIFVDPMHCKGCSACVTVCHELGYDALRMTEKAAIEPDGERVIDRAQRDFRFFRDLPPTPVEYRNERALADLMLGEHALGYVGGAGSCSGCGEATALRMLLAATRQVHGPESMGMVAATGCNTVYGSTYPFNPYQIPWTNSLFENAPAVALGIRARWDAEGHRDRRLWVVGGDGAMYDIGFQATLADGRVRRRHQGPRPRHAGLLEYRRTGVDRDVRRAGHEAVGLREGAARATRNDARSSAGS